MRSRGLAIYQCIFSEQILATQSSAENATFEMHDCVSLPNSMHEWALLLVSDSFFGAGFCLLGSQGKLSQQGGRLAIPIQNQNMVLNDNRIVATPDSLHGHTSWVSRLLYVQVPGFRMSYQIYFCGDVNATHCMNILANYLSGRSVQKNKH